MEVSQDQQPQVQLVLSALSAVQQRLERLAQVVSERAFLGLEGAASGGSPPPEEEPPQPGDTTSVELPEEDSEEPEDSEEDSLVVEVPEEAGKGTPAK